MKPLKDAHRANRRRNLTPEFLEERLVLSANQGSTFAIMPGTVSTAGQVSTVTFKIDPALFTAPKDGKIVFGIDVASASSSSTSATTLKPEVVGVTSSTGKHYEVTHSKYNAQVAKANKLGNQDTSAGLVTLPVPKSGQAPATYTVEVKGLKNTTGQYLLGFYLPGDVAGTGTVTAADIKTIKSELGMTASNSSYNFDADANRNGQVTKSDLSIAQENLGATVSVSPVVSVNLNPASDPTATGTSPYQVVNYQGATTPGATVTFVDQQGGASTVVTAGSNGQYSIAVPLQVGSNTFNVTTSDGFGQSITGTISPVIYSPSLEGSTSTSSSS